MNSKRFQLSTWIFYGTILLLLWPLFKFTFIFTHDGPAHIYNACLIRRFISGNTLVSEFLTLKSFPEPNWTGHFLLAIFSSVFKAPLAEKIFLGLYIVLFPYFFRKLLQNVNRKYSVISLLILPFIYSYFFFGGLYNFLAGVTILFGGLAFIFPLIERNKKSKYFWILVFSLLLYFSHLLTLGVFLIIICLAHVFNYFNKSNTRSVREFIVSSIPFALALFPSLLLTIFYFIKKLHFASGNSEVPFLQQLDFLLHITSIITLKYYPENYYSLVLFALFILLIITSLVKRSRHRAEMNREHNVFYSQPQFWALASGMMLLLYFVIPDQAATGGVVKFRFQLFFFLFLIVWFCSISTGKFMSILITLTISCWVTLKFFYFLPLMNALNNDAEQAIKITPYMKQNSILLPLNYSGNWMHSNLFNYAGTDKNILVLDNYEAGMPHFPLEWKEGKNPVDLLGKFNGNVPLCANVDHFEKMTNHFIDYIATYNYNTLTDSCSVSLSNTLKSGYDLILNDNDNLKLYKRKILQNNTAVK